MLRWPRLAWVHIPSAAWGAFIEFSGWICPLTPLENALRLKGNEAGYTGGFVEHYIMPVLYPAGLSRPAQVMFGTFVLVLNVAAYWLLNRRNHRSVHPPSQAGKPSQAGQPSQAGRLSN